MTATTERTTRLTFTDYSLDHQAHRPVLCSKPSGLLVRIVLWSTLLSGPVWAWSRATDAFADSWLPPARPLTAEERLESTIGLGGPIFVGTVVEVRDTTAEIGTAGAPSWRHNQFIAVQPSRWLRGGESRSIQLIGIRPDDIAQMKSQMSSRQETVFFVVPAPRLGTGQDRGRMRGRPSQIPWQLTGGPYIVGNGILPISTTGRSEELTAIDDVMRRESIDSLATNADVVIVAHRRADSHLEREQGQFALTVEVDSTVAGLNVPSELRVRSIVPDDLPDDEALIYLRRLSDGSFAVVVPGAASDRIRSGRSTRSSMSVTDCVALIRRVRRAPK